MVSQTSIGSIQKPSEFLKKFIATSNGARKGRKEQHNPLLASSPTGDRTPNDQG